MCHSELASLSASRLDNGPWHTSVKMSTFPMRSPTLQGFSYPIVHAPASHHRGLKYVREIAKEHAPECAGVSIEGTDSTHCSGWQCRSGVELWSSPCCHCTTQARPAAARHLSERCHSMSLEQHTGTLSHRPARRQCEFTVLCCNMYLS